MYSTNRRDALRKGAVLGVGIATSGAAPKVTAGTCSGAGSDSRWDGEYNFGHTILFMEEYHNGILGILGCISGELEHIGELSSRAASVIRNGGTVCQNMNLGHMPIYEQSENRWGNPGVIKDHKVMTKVRNAAAITQPAFEHLKKGDMVFTNYCNSSLQAARDRGVYVVSVTVNYIKNEFQPDGYVLPNEEDILLKDVSNEILHSYIPVEQGLVHMPEMPYMAICPSSSNILGALYWMLSGEIANKLADRNAKEVDKSAEYLAILTKRIQNIKETHMERIRETAVEITHRVRDGGRWFVRSIEHRGLQSELQGVASGPWMPNRGDWNANKTKNNMLIAGISPAFPDEVKLALEKQIEGAFVIGIGPASLDGVVPPGRLIDVADAGFDNFSPESGGVIRIKGRDDSVCPTSGIVSNVIQQMICAQWADEMARRGSVPYFCFGIYRVGVDFYRQMTTFAEKRGY